MEDTKLVQRLKAGDRSAFDALYVTYQNTLLRMAYLVCGSMADAEDVVQETFVKCYLHIGELKCDEGFRAWLFRILYRTAYRWAKKSRREISDEDVYVKADVSCKDAASDTALDREMQETVRRAVHSLGFKHRMVVVLYYYNDMPVKEIARVLGTTEGTVKSRLFGARKKLSESLKRLEEGGVTYENTKKTCF